MTKIKACSTVSATRERKKEQKKQKAERAKAA
jgi:hypothetical protein